MTPELAELLHLGVENALNAALRADPHTQARVRSLQGARLRLEVHGLPRLDLLPEAQGIRVCDIGDETPDATLRGSLFGLLRAKWRGDLMHGDIELLGDPHLSLATARLLAELQPDIEIALTPHVGELIAHQIGRAWRSLQGEIQRSMQHHLLNKADWIHDEIDVSPRAVEIDDWMNAVDQMQHRVHNLEHRLRALEKTQ